MQTEQGQSCCERLLEKEKLGGGELKKIITGKEVNLKRKDEIIYGNEIAKLIAKTK
jgi:hypothetical protein